MELTRSNTLRRLLVTEALRYFGEGKHKGKIVIVIKT